MPPSLKKIVNKHNTN